ncbi:MAG: enoyl-CoA hydratase/isomerase family protein [Alphaproteobacteria bacterium]|nr:enoyl-CoA hydratase/isomerase family protein [Alphaproteobacteria bacterium]
MNAVFEKMTFEVEDGVAIVTIKRPEARNALDDAVRRDLDRAIAQIEDGAGSTIHAAVLTGAGGAFCAGGDLNALKELSGKPASDMRRRLRASHPRMTRWFNLEVPTIAAVDGAAAGAGFSLALACDFVIASPRARFVLSFGRIGLVPDWGALYLLPRIVGLQKAKELAFSARIVEPEEARALGIVYDIVGEGEAVSQAVALANRFRNASSLAIAMTKNMLNQSFEHDLQSLLELEASAQAIANNSDYHRSAVARFLDKQPTLFDWEKQSG